jgi:hypothetical protein
MWGTGGQRDSRWQEPGGHMGGEGGGNCDRALAGLVHGCSRCATTTPGSAMNPPPADALRPGRPPHCASTTRPSLLATQGA